MRKYAFPKFFLRARLDQAWAARHSSPHHREVLGQLLPALIEDIQLAAHQSDDRATRRAAQAVLAEVYALSQSFIAYQPAQDLLWRVAERGMVAAHGNWQAVRDGVTLTAESPAGLLVRLQAQELSRLQAVYGKQWKVWCTRRYWMATARVEGGDPTLMEETPGTLEAKMRDPAPWGSRSLGASATL